MDLKEVEEQRKRIDGILEDTLSMLGKKIRGLAQALEDAYPTEKDYRQSYRDLETAPAIPEGVKRGDALRSMEILVPGYDWGAKVTETAASWYGTTEMTIEMDLGCASSLCWGTESIKLYSDICYIRTNFGDTGYLCGPRMVEALLFIMSIALDHQRRQESIWKSYGQKWLDDKGNITEKP